MNKIILDENGMVVGEIHEGDRIIRGTSVEAYKNSIKINEGVSFVKLYLNNLADIVDLLTDPQIATMIRLLPYI